MSDLQHLLEQATPGPWVWNGERQLGTLANAPPVAQFVDHWACDPPDVTSVDIAFVILTQALEVPQEDITDAIEKAREAE